MPSATQISEFNKSVFSAPLNDGKMVSHDVYQRGSGPAVVIIQELPGIGQETLALADEFVDAGFSVVMPHLFGPLGKTSMVGNLMRVFCMRREFQIFQANKSSAIVDWLKALCRDVQAQNSVPGVGVIGMCLTGNFAISLMADDSVLAAVASQPSIPVGKSSALHMSDADVETISQRIDATHPIKAYRFAGDPLCDAKKFAAIEETFNCGDKQRIELNTLPGRAHSVLTIDFVNQQGHPTRQALDDILSYFRQQLSGETSSV